MSLACDLAFVQKEKRTTVIIHNRSHKFELYKHQYDKNTFRNGSDCSLRGSLTPSHVHFLCIPVLHSKDQADKVIYDFIDTYGG